MLEGLLTNEKTFFIALEVFSLIFDSYNSLTFLIYLNADYSYMLNGLENEN